MISLEVGVYNEKKDTEKVKEFRVDYCDDCDSVVVELGNESFVIDYGVWKAINNYVVDRKDGDLIEYNGGDCEECYAEQIGNEIIESIEKKIDNIEDKHNETYISQVSSLEIIDNLLTAEMVKVPKDVEAIVKLLREKNKLSKGEECVNG